MSRGLGFVALGLLLLACGAAAAHGGGLNAEGCHGDRQTGDYHCHRAAARAPAATMSPARAEGNVSAIRGTAAHYRSCSEARAAGAAPVRRGDPGYGRHLDRDNDGSGCE